MGSFVTVRGWLECDRPQLARIAEILAAAAAAKADRPYSGGWTVPERRPMWTCTVFFGADARSQFLPLILDEVRALAELPASDEDGDRLTGLFVVSHETEGTVEWRVHDGMVTIAESTDRYRYLTA